MANLYSTISLNTPSLRSKISQSYQEKLETMLKQHFQWGKTKRSMRDMKMAKRERKKILKARNNFCSERVDSIPFLYLVPAFLSPRKAAEPSLPSYLSLGGGVLCILRGVLWGRKFSNSVTEVIIQCKFFFLLLADSPPRDLEILPTNNGLLMRNDVQLCLAANNILLTRKWNHAILLHAIALAWKWQIASDPLENKLGDRMMKQLSNSDIANYHDILLNLVK